MFLLILCLCLWVYDVGYCQCCSVLVRTKTNIDLMAGDFQCLVMFLITLYSFIFFFNHLIPISLAWYLVKNIVRVCLKCFEWYAWNLTLICRGFVCLLSYHIRYFIVDESWCFIEQAVSWIIIDKLASQLIKCLYADLRI